MKNEPNHSIQPANLRQNIDQHVPASCLHINTQLINWMTLNSHENEFLFNANLNTPDQYVLPLFPFILAIQNNHTSSKVLWTSKLSQKILTTTFGFFHCSTIWCLFCLIQRWYVSYTLLTVDCVVAYLFILICFPRPNKLSIFALCALHSGE